MTRPLMLDAFCCAGGAAKGYYDAGFDIIGVDIEPQPRYPFPFIQGDALEVGRALLATGRIDAVHASPPCQAHSDLQKQNKRTYADFIPQTRAMLEGSRLPYVIENVEGAPLRRDLVLCGGMFFDLRVYRHRIFECHGFLPEQPAHRPHFELTYTHDKRKGHYGQPLDLSTMRVQVTGGGNAPVWAKAQAMGIDWMTGKELNEAIPPAYTRWIGDRLLRAVRNRQEAVA